MRNRAAAWLAYGVVGLLGCCTVAGCGGSGGGYSGGTPSPSSSSTPPPSTSGVPRLTSTNLSHVTVGTAVVPTIKGVNLVGASIFIFSDVRATLSNLTATALSVSSDGTQIYCRFDVPSDATTGVFKLRVFVKGVEATQPASGDLMVSIDPAPTP